MKGTKIEWATHTFNPWIGCQKVSAACKYCYAETQVNRFGGHFSAVRRMTTDSYWKQPIKWNKEAQDTSERPRVFCASLADVFENWHGPMLDSKGRMICRNRFETDNWFSDREPIVDEHAITMDDVRARLFALIDATPNLDWLLLTKRPEHIRKMWPFFYNQIGTVRLSKPNVWLGTTVENRESLHRIDSLKSNGDLARFLFLSIEPLLEALPTLGEHLDGIDWVIVGGESGPHARPMHPDWARSIRDQCQALQIPFHFKQWGEWLPANSANYATGSNQWRYGKVQGLSMLRTGSVCLRNNAECQSDKCEEVDAFALSQYHRFGLEATGYHWMHKVGKKAAGRMLDGREWNELPRGDI